MRLVDADAAKNKVRREMANADLDKTGFAICIGLINMFDDAGQLPTIEAEPVRHGKWINAYDTHGGSYYKCSRCACYIEKIFFANDYDVNFCPNCGAKMDKEE